MCSFSLTCPSKVAKTVGQYGSDDFPELDQPKSAR